MAVIPFPHRERHPLRFRRLTVVKTTTPGHCFRRLTLGGAQLEGFASSGYDDHVKVLFPADPDTFGLPEAGEEGIIWSSDERPPTRDYTPIFDAESQTLDLDFYLHDGGVASQWAQRVQPGDPVFIGGPRGSLVVPLHYEWQLYLCDESGMPALRQRLLALRHAGFRGQLHVAAICRSAASRGYLADLDDFSVNWFDNQDQAAVTQWLAQRLPLAQGQPMPWTWMVGEGEFIKRTGVPFYNAGIDARLVRQVAYWHAK